MSSGFRKKNSGRSGGESVFHDPGAAQSDSVPTFHALSKGADRARRAKLNRPPKGTNSMTKVMKFGVGQGVELRAVFLRSPYGHARFRIEDLEAARAAPGVRGVFVASDFSNLGPLPC